MFSERLSNLNEKEEASRLAEAYTKKKRRKKASIYEITPKGLKISKTRRKRMGGRTEGYERYPPRESGYRHRTKT